MENAQKKMPRPHGKIHKLLSKFGIIWCTRVRVHIIIFISSLWSLIHVRDHKNDAAMHAKWSFALAHALALSKARIIRLLALYRKAMLIKSSHVLDYALGCLDLPYCCSTTQSNLVVQFIVGAAITNPAAVGGGSCTCWGCCCCIWATSSLLTFALCVH